MVSVVISDKMFKKDNNAKSASMLDSPSSRASSEDIVYGNDGEDLLEN